MRIKSRVLAASLCGALAASSALPEGAQATTELAAVADARSVGMGGTGTSFMHNAAAVVLNPGALQGIDKFAVNLHLQPGVGQQSVPFGPTQVDGERTFVPFFLVGAGMRVHERIVVALAVSPTVGFGSKYQNVAALGGNDLSATISSMEASAAVSVKLLDNLSLGVGYRVTYSMADANLLNTDPTTNTTMRLESDMSGINALGARVGLHYAPTSHVKLGLTYTSKITTELDGKTKATILGVGPAGSLDTRQDLASPHALRAGGSVALLDDKLLLALDFKALFYAESNKKMVTETDMPTPMGTVTQKQTQRQDWKNVYSGNLGVEYKVVDMVALRLGYSLSNSATPAKTAGPIGIGPGLINTFHGGVGVQAMEALNIDVGAFYVMVSDEIKPPKPNAGTYDMNIIMGALSATYRR